MECRTIKTNLLAVLMLGLGICQSHAALINEFNPNPTGADPDTQQVELLGTPGAVFNGSLLFIDSDQSTASGRVDRIELVDSVFDNNGLLTITILDVENPSHTLVLTANDGAIALNDDLDMGNDGALDNASLFGTVFDAVNVPDSMVDRDSNIFAEQLGGIDLAFVGSEPTTIFRDARSRDWLIVDAVNGVLMVFTQDGVALDIGDFSGDPVTNSFGAINASQVPLPGAMLFFLSALTALWSATRHVRLSPAMNRMA